MTLRWGILIAVLAAAAILVLALPGLLPAGGTEGSGETPAPAGETPPPVSPGGTPVTLPGPSRTPVVTPSPAPAPRPVSFTLQASPPVSCGLTCRETTATITNTGDETAHDVCVVIALQTDAGESIPVNSGPSFQKCTGDIPGGASRTETVQVTADCGLLASRCIGHTLVLKTRVTSREATQEFPDTLISV